jgi:hypothetical protein
MVKKSKLRLVGSHDPASVFNDLDTLRRAQAAPAAPLFRGTAGSAASKPSPASRMIGLVGYTISMGRLGRC